MEVKEVEEVVRILKAEGSQINHDLTYRMKRTLHKEESYPDTKIQQCE